METRSKITLKAVANSARPIRDFSDDGTSNINQVYGTHEKASPAFIRAQNDSFHATSTDSSLHDDININRTIGAMSMPRSSTVYKSEAPDVPGNYFSSYKSPVEMQFTAPRILNNSASSYYRHDNSSHPNRSFANSLVDPMQINSMYNTSNNNNDNDDCHSKVSEAGSTCRRVDLLVSEPVQSNTITQHFSLSSVPLAFSSAARKT